jgi:RNA polymerase sigma-70 factor (ECF subfamily)
MTMALTPDAAPAESDADLAARFERDALPLRSVLLRGARRLTRNETDAEDLLQDTFLAAYRGFGKFTQGTNLQAWLFRIMRNTWINNFRYRQRRPAEVTLEGLTDRVLAGDADRTHLRPRAAELEALDALPDSRIVAALRALPEPQRLVVFYADIEGFTYAETAEILCAPLGTVMSRLSRGRKRLRIALADLADCHHSTEAADLVA